MHFGVTFKHLLTNTVIDSCQGLLHFSQGSTKPIRKRLLPKCCTAASAWRTPRLASKKGEPWATEHEHMQKELQLWNVFWTLTCKEGEDIPLAPWRSHALSPQAIWPHRIGVWGELPERGCMLCCCLFLARVIGRINTCWAPVSHLWP